MLVGAVLVGAGCTGSDSRLECCSKFEPFAVCAAGADAAASTPSSAQPAVESARSAKDYWGLWVPHTRSRPVSIPRAPRQPRPPVRAGVCWSSPPRLAAMCWSCSTCSTTQSWPGPQSPECARSCAPWKLAELVSWRPGQDCACPRRFQPAKRCRPPNWPRRQTGCANRTLRTNRPAQLKPQQRHRSDRPLPGSPPFADFRPARFHRQAWIRYHRWAYYHRHRQVVRCLLLLRLQVASRWEECRLRLPRQDHCHPHRHHRQHRHPQVDPDSKIHLQRNSSRRSLSVPHAHPRTARCRVPGAHPGSR